MAHVVKTFTTVTEPDAAFAYLADFTHALEWDPTVVAAERADEGEIGPGSRFDLTVRIGGRRLRGVLVLADPLLAVGFRRVADRAIQGLERCLRPAVRS